MDKKNFYYGKKMNSAYLNENQVNLLFHYTKRNSLIYKCLNRSDKKKIFNNKLIINFNENEKEQFLDELTFLLTSIGLDNDSEINERGIIIEDIIDQILNDKPNN